jgi:YD repeat-containing protein
VRTETPEGDVYFNYLCGSKLASISRSGKGLSSWSLARDNAGRIVRKAETAGGSAASYDYVYDANGRLLRVLKRIYGVTS